MTRFVVIEGTCTLAQYRAAEAAGRITRPVSDDGELGDATAIRRATDARTSSIIATVLDDPLSMVLAGVRDRQARAARRRALRNRAPLPPRSAQERRKQKNGPPVADELPGTVERPT